MEGPELVLGQGSASNGMEVLGQALGWGWRWGMLGQGIYVGWR